MHIEFLVEEASAENFLLNIVPKILGDSVTFKIHPHQGKPHLLKKLPDLLKGYKAWMPDDWRIVVLIDADEDDCQELKAKLERIANDIGLSTKSSSVSSSSFQVLNRLAIKELEAWYFGDVQAINAAYPRIPVNLAAQAKYRDPDNISGGTWEALEKVFQRRGYHSAGLPKIFVAREISHHMEPQRNRSKSFQVFRLGILEMIREEM